MHYAVTPLERAVGFYVSEQVYDLLTFSEQVMVDMRIEGFNDLDIATIFGIRLGDVQRVFQLIRTKLAGSALTFHIEMKQYYREQTTKVMDETELADGFITENLFEPHKPLGYKKVGY